MKKNLAWSVVVGLADADPVAGLTLAAVLLGLLALPVVLGRTRSALLTAHGVV